MIIGSFLCKETGGVDLLWEGALQNEEINVWMGEVPISSLCAVVDLDKG